LVIKFGIGDETDGQEESHNRSHTARATPKGTRAERGASDPGGSASVAARVTRGAW
jgi:hypothetical protein